MMVRPACFGFNPETAGSNAFQRQPVVPEVHAPALREFEALVSALRQAGVEVLDMEHPDPQVPDAIFPNNWFSTHAGGTLVLYPMMAPNRRLERLPALISAVKGHCGITRVVDLRHHEGVGSYLEGTGSMVFDHPARRVYAAESPRTHLPLLEEIGRLLDYRLHIFQAVDTAGLPVYHTNVVMCMVNGGAVVCLESMVDEDARNSLVRQLEQDGRWCMEISMRQMEMFCGNMLLLRCNRGTNVLVLSATAAAAFSETQRQQLFAGVEPVIVSIPVIEQVGGGGVRCMLAELYQ